MNKVQMDRFTKTVTLQGPDGKKIVFRGEKCHIKLYYLSYGR
jgi:hypothetical protein